MGNVTVKRVIRDKFEQTIEDSTIEGWQLKNQNDNVAIMQKYGSIGSFWVHLILLFFTLGLGNILYAIYAYYTKAQELHIKVDE